jgi:hypothetical protein
VTPLMSKVKRTLRKGGYKFCSRDKYPFPFHRPCGRKFATIEELRRDLCEYGVNCKCRTNVSGHECMSCECWDEDDKQVNKEWVRFNVIQGPKKIGCANPMIPTEFLKQATRLGCVKVRSSLFDGYKLPCVKSPVVDGILGLTTFKTYLDLLEFLSRFGFPNECSFDAMSEDERFDLQVFLADYDDRATL